MKTKISKKMSLNKLSVANLALLNQKEMALLGGYDFLAENHPSQKGVGGNCNSNSGGLPACPPADKK